MIFGFWCINFANLLIWHIKLLIFLRLTLKPHFKNVKLGKTSS